MKTGDIKTNATKIKKEDLGENIKKVYANKLDKQEMDKLLETYTLASRSNYETKSLIRYKILRISIQESETS